MENESDTGKSLFIGKGAVVEAKYISPELPKFSNNPCILALPSINTRKQALTAMQGRTLKRYIKSLIFKFESLDEKDRRRLAGYISYCRSIEPDFINRLILKFGFDRIQRAQYPDKDVMNPERILELNVPRPLINHSYYLLYEPED